MADPQTKIIITAKDEASSVFDRLNTNVKGVAAAVAGAFAADSLLGFAQSLVPVADAASELEARLRLAVGESGNLDAALQSVRASANETGAEINSIGELYGRVASSTAELGYSQERVADLTATINRSFSVSGTSAQAASGAITQLAQAFASGALRGDEFNSVNEAAPRLMQALADGLGVARGELRAMAEQGKLTTEVVLGALESQRDAIQRDFEQLPDTIGRATQKLANEWQVFIGELNQTTGATEAVAGGLSMIADNLDEIASVAATAGEVLVTGLAIKAAASLREFVASAAASATGTKALSTAVSGLAAAGQGAVASMFSLGRALPALGVAGVVLGVGALAVEFFRAKNAAEEADEAVRKMLEEPPVNHVAEEIRLVATEAEAVRFKLADVQQQFMNMAAGGASAAEALGKIAAAADIQSVDGIAKLVADMQLLEQSALATGEQIQTAIADRLAKMSGKELREFGMQAETAFAQGQIGAEQLANVLEARAIAAAKKLGTELSLSADGFTAKFRDAADSLDVLVDSFDLIEQAGTNAAGVLQGTFATALKAASNPKELEHLAEVIKRAGENGKLSGEQVSTMLDDIRTKTDQVTPGINSVAEALKELGIVSDAALKDTADRFQEAYQAVVKMGGSVREQEAAFTRWAEAAVKANGGVVDASVKAAAAQQRMQVTADESGRVIVKRMSDVYSEVLSVKDAADGAAGSFSDMATNAAAAAKEVETIANFKSIMDRPTSKTIDGANYSDLISKAASIGGEDGRQQALAIVQAAVQGSNRALTNGNGFAIAEETVRRYLEDLIARLERNQKRDDDDGPRSSTSSQHVVKINIAGRSVDVNTASESDSTRLIGVLEELQRRSQ